METRNKIDVHNWQNEQCSNITDGIIADACWKTPTVPSLWSVKGFKYLFLKRWGYKLSNRKVALGQYPIWKKNMHLDLVIKNKGNWTVKHSQSH